MNNQFKSIVIGLIRSWAAAAAGFVLVIAAKYSVVLPEDFSTELTGIIAILLMGVYYGVVRGLASIKGLEWLEWFLIVPTTPMYPPTVDKPQMVTFQKQIETRRLKH